MVWTGVIDRSANNGVPAALLGLTVDRCLVLFAGAPYGPRAKRLVCWATAIATVGGDIAIFCEIINIPYRHDPGKDAPEGRIHFFLPHTSKNPEDL